MTPRIDAHQHFWQVARGDYGWLTPDMAVHRDYGPAELAPLRDAAGIAGSVLVQAAPTEAETEFLCGIAAADPTVLGVVGWTDFEAPDAPARIATLAARPGLVGLRPMIQDLPDDTWMLRDDVGACLGAMEDAGLVFDALVLPRHLQALRTLLARHPGLRVVIDHAAKPVVTADGPPKEWVADMRALGAETRASCKLSGLVTKAPDGWSVEMLRPYVEVLLDAFGPERLIWGSDWPVCTLAAGYGEWVAATEALLGRLSETERAAVMGGNAAQVYRLVF
ncbi:MAG: amidohydrolase family protein [Shimia sp.]